MEYIIPTKISFHIISASSKLWLTTNESLYKNLMPKWCATNLTFRTAHLLVFARSALKLPFVNLQSWCQALHIVTQYFMLANYMWMFCEGLHLHLALVVVFVRDEVTIKWFMAVGWGLPFIIVTIYAVVRKTFEPNSTEL